MISTLKLLVGGDGAVGKTSLLKRYVDDEFSAILPMTIGVSFFKKTEIVNDTECVMAIWDLAGQERFRFLSESYTKGAVGGLLLFDLLNYETTKNLQWWVELLRFSDPNLPLLLIGTKMDLVTLDTNTITDEEALELMGKLGCFNYLKTSSKLGLGVTEAFQMVCERVMNSIR